MDVQPEARTGRGGRYLLRLTRRTCPHELNVSKSWKDRKELSDQVCISSLIAVPSPGEL